METTTTLKNEACFARRAKFYFDKVTSNHGHDWMLALTWIFVFEFFSSILEYNYLEVAQNYIYHIPESIYKEIGIALLLVSFIWYTVYMIIFMKRYQFFYVAVFAAIGLYLIVTHDVTFNLLIHNILNPFEFEFNGFGFYMIVQLFIKAIITYLLYMMLVSIRNRKANK